MGIEEVLRGNIPKYKLLLDGRMNFDLFVHSNFLYFLNIYNQFVLFSLSPNATLENIFLLLDRGHARVLFPQLLLSAASHF